MGRPISGNRPVDPQRRLFWKVCSRPLPLKDKPPVGKIKTARVGEPVVYYVRLGPHIKIGHTADLRRRLVAFRNAVAEATVLATEPGAEELAS